MDRPTIMEFVARKRDQQIAKSMIDAAVGWTGDGAR
jgi:hypothetical protein